MKQSAQRRWKGCPMCKGHKYRGNGDRERTKHTVLKQIGVARRFSRNKVYE